LVPTLLRCRECTHEWAVDFPVFRCPACEAGGAEVLTGNEFEVESIEVEEAECIAQR
jgi:Zn finger protein HypA/HybF involved in hydrogenase expression